MSKITESARDEECQIRIPDVCNHDNRTTVWCHANGMAAGKGVGMKSHDILGSYGCSACHDVYDRRVKAEWSSRTQVELAFWQGHARSVCILVEKGLLVTERGKVAA